jgi:predicted transcriptional regulator
VSNEPRVLCEDVKRALNQAGVTADKKNKGSVEKVALSVGVTPRTIYRILDCRTESIKLDLADRVLLAVGCRVNECRLVWKDGGRVGRS